jgi:hypothetical protein
MRTSFYVDLLITEWGIEKCSPRLQACMRRVLGELSPGAQLRLRKNPKLQIVVLSEADRSVWAYFPIHPKRTVIRHLDIKLKRGAAVLLVLSEKHFQEQSVRITNAELRDHLGHALLYLRSPRKRNECEDALREWQESVHKSAH